MVLSAEASSIALSEFDFLARFKSNLQKDEGDLIDNVFIKLYS
jgi:hypothetical protein